MGGLFVIGSSFVYKFSPSNSPVPFEMEIEIKRNSQLNYWNKIVDRKDEAGNFCALNV